MKDNVLFYLNIPVFTQETPLGLFAPILIENTHFKPWLYHGARRNTFGTGEIIEVQGKDVEIKEYILLINGAPGRI